MRAVANKKELDKEWVELIIKAKSYGLSKNEVRLFLAEVKEHCS